MTRERVMSEEFLLTHEFLAHMRGMRREGVTEAARGLKQRESSHIDAAKSTSLT